MVRDFGLTDDEKLVGQYSGYIGGAFPLAMALTA
jgi:hypothetical protein